MEWTIYIILGFLFWKHFPLFSVIVFTVVLVALLRYVWDDSTTVEEDQWPDGLE